MPEGPEVKTTTDFLSTFKGKSFSSFAVLSGRYTKKGGIPNDSVAVLPATIKSVDCKGKFIYFTFVCEDNSEYYMFSTLGMTGMWSREKTKHSRFCIFFDDEDILYYNDIRNFGTLKFVKNKSDLDKKLKTLGPDVLNCNIDWQGFRNRFLKKHNKTITECLMDQSVVCGIGNYLKSEILYSSKISPHRLVKDITVNEWHDLYYNSLTIPQRSYKLGGATIKDYRKADGTKGSFSRRFAVYNCKTDPKNNIIIKETTKDKRSTYWVPEIQK
jgi:formamidopyrimidine-DNA glycosylase